MSGNKVLKVQIFMATSRPGKKGALQPRGLKTPTVSLMQRMQMMCTDPALNSRMRCPYALKHQKRNWFYLRFCWPKVLYSQRADEKLPALVGVSDNFGF